MKSRYLLPAFILSYRKEFMRFHEKLYVGQSIQHVQHVRHLLRIGAGQFDIYLITVSKNSDQLDIFDSKYLKDKRHYDRKTLQIAGLAGSMGEAYGLVEQMAKDSCELGVPGQLREYLYRTDGSGKWKY